MEGLRRLVKAEERALALTASPTVTKGPLPLLHRVRGLPYPIPHAPKHNEAAMVTFEFFYLVRKALALWKPSRSRVLPDRTARGRAAWRPDLGGREGEWDKRGAWPLQTRGAETGALAWEEEGVMGDIVRGESRKRRRSQFNSIGNPLSARALAGARTYTLSRSLVLRGARAGPKMNSWGGQGPRATRTCAPEGRSRAASLTFPACHTRHHQSERSGVEVRVGLCNDVPTTGWTHPRTKS